MAARERPSRNLSDLGSVGWGGQREEEGWVDGGGRAAGGGGHGCGETATGKTSSRARRGVKNVYVNSRRAKLQLRKGILNLLQS
jgi:hypothetical protein